MKHITIKDCLELRDKFMAYADRAEQHEFIMLAMVHTMMNNSIDDWQEKGINQKEANAMFRVVLKCIGGDFSEYVEEE
jgi:hypothetical protein